jgi:magnesium chelatase family protein
MAHTTLSRSLFGLVSSEVRVTAEILPDAQIKISGLSLPAAREVAIRVSSSLASEGMYLGASVRIEPPQVGSSGHLDLAVAAAILGAHGRACPQLLPDAILLGELSLAGDLRQIRGVGPMLAQADRPAAVVPDDNAAEVYRSQGRDFTVATLGEFIAGKLRTSVRLDAPIKPRPLGVVLVGAKGSGKTLIARQMAEAIGFIPSRDVDSIYSVAGLLPPEGYVSRAPFRAPHHSVSEAGLLGGGTTPRPGEVSLAHQGTLFLDELTEFRTSALESLFRVLKAGRSEFGRGESLCAFPSRPALVVAASENTPRLATLVERFGLLMIPIENHFLLARAIEQARS